MVAIALRAIEQTKQKALEETAMTFELGALETTGWDDVPTYGWFVEVMGDWRNDLNFLLCGKAGAIGSIDANSCRSFVFRYDGMIRAEAEELYSEMSDEFDVRLGSGGRVMKAFHHNR